MLPLWIGGISNSADAACGDWLQHEAVRQPASPVPWTLSETSPQRQPCDGPGCRNAPVDSSPLVPATIPGRQADDRMVTDSVDELDLDRQGMTSEVIATEKPTKGHSRQIDRPPRAA